MIDKHSTGLYAKFTVTRTDDKSAPGEKHDGCEYFVLDVTHDKHAHAALKAYADSCEGEYPLLARDVRIRAQTQILSGLVAPAEPQTPEPEQCDGDCGSPFCSALGRPPVSSSARPDKKPTTPRCTHCGSRRLGYDPGEVPGQGVDYCVSCGMAQIPESFYRIRELEKEVNGWREIGEEVQRIVVFLTPDQRDDLLPDWFLPRLSEKLRAGTVQGLSTEAASPSVAHSAPKDSPSSQEQADARPARTLKDVREWAGNRADRSAGRGKPEIFEAWREMVDHLDALLSGKETPDSVPSPGVENTGAVETPRCATCEYFKRGSNDPERFEPTLIAAGNNGTLWVRPDFGCVLHQLRSGGSR